jgi:hypothetical protein
MATISDDKTATSSTAANENGLNTMPTSIHGYEKLEPQVLETGDKEEAALTDRENNASPEPWLSELVSTSPTVPLGSIDQKQEDLDTNPDAKYKHKFAQGMKPEILNLFEGPPKCKCCTNWVEEYPDDIKENVEAAYGTRQYALLVRKRKSHQKYNADPLEIDSIVVHSPLIKTVLKEVFDGYPGVTVDLEYLSFNAPFAAFLHRWTVLDKAVESESKEEVRKHMALL